MTSWRTSSSSLACVWILAVCARAAEPPVDYLRDVKPILAANCYKCHGPDEQEADLRLDTAREAIAGGASGPAIVPGRSDRSLLMAAMKGDGDAARMPPEDEADPLSPEQIALVRRWIDAGAAAPADEVPLPATRARRASAHWAFQPIRRPAPPVVRGSERAGHPIDAFILAELERRRISPASEADRVTLLRRASLDIVGLPPTAHDVAEFASDNRPGAYGRAIERLLASPHYGERWGRWWLDQARYADSDGYTNDEPRPMWRWRDWVIDAFNRNQPFDEFIVEQLAGDLLPQASVEQQIATGFHRNTQTYSEGASATEEYRVENVVDRVHTTGVVLLGLTLGCARCHDHKFDPISQREFFQLYAFFNNQDEPRSDVPIASPVRGEPLAQGDMATTPVLVLRERAEPRETFIHIRGDFLSPGKRVFPGLPAALLQQRENAAASAGFRTRLDLARWLVAQENPLTARVIVNRLWKQYFGRGLVETDDDFGTRGERPTHPELLDWLASEFRLSGWDLKHMQRLIVTSAAYRQSSAARPELADIDPRNLLVARQQRLRLDAEQIRDSALAASGLLSHKLKGPSVFPPQPKGVMELTQHATRTWTVSPGEDRYRRGLYTFFWRTSPHPFLTLFDAPEANTACTARRRSNTPLQAMTLLNDEAFVEAAQSLAGLALREAATDDDARLALAFERCLRRRPSIEELGVLRKLLADERAESPHREHDAWTAVARTLLNLDEFVTRE